MRPRLDDERLSDAFAGAGDAESRLVRKHGTPLPESKALCSATQGSRRSGSDLVAAIVGQRTEWPSRRWEGPVSGMRRRPGRGRGALSRSRTTGACGGRRGSAYRRVRCGVDGVLAEAALDAAHAGVGVGFEIVAVRSELAVADGLDVPSVQIDGVIGRWQAGVDDGNA